MPQLSEEHRAMHDKWRSSSYYSAQDEEELSLRCYLNAYRPNAFGSYGGCVSIWSEEEAKKATLDKILSGVEHRITNGRLVEEEPLLEPENQDRARDSSRRKLAYSFGTTPGSLCQKQTNVTQGECACGHKTASECRVPSVRRRNCCRQQRRTTGVPEVTLV